jgi:hypothetical protein
MYRLGQVRQEVGESGTATHHTPHAPSRLNPTYPRSGLGKRKLSIAQGRGTMSMPTSPLRQGVNDEVAWEVVSISAYWY